MLHLQFHFITSLLLLFVVPQLVVSESYGQGVETETADLDKGPKLDSCSMLLPADGSDDFLRILYPLSDNDTTQVRVSIAFQIADHSPCYLEETTPVELYFPEMRYSFKVEEKDRSGLRLIYYQKGKGPVITLWDIPGMCVVVEENREYEMDCSQVNY